MAMPETNIGLFPDVGGGYFLSRCPGRLGEYLALTGNVIGGADAVAAGLADVLRAVGRAARAVGTPARERDRRAPRERSAAAAAAGAQLRRRSAAEIDRVFAPADSVAAIVAALGGRRRRAWAARHAAALRKRSPLMLHVTLEQVRRARAMSLADDLRMERDMVRHCFHLRPGAASETVEGIRALAIDKDHAPRWNPARIEDVTPEMVQAFFRSPWPAHAHPLRGRWRLEVGARSASLAG